MDSTASLLNLSTHLEHHYINKAVFGKVGAADAAAVGLSIPIPGPHELHPLPASYQLFRKLVERYQWSCCVGATIYYTPIYHGISPLGALCFAPAALDLRERTRCLQTLQSSTLKRLKT